MKGKGMGRNICTLGKPLPFRRVRGLLRGLLKGHSTPHPHPHCHDS